MEKQALLAAFLCLLILLAYQEYVQRYYPPRPAARPVAEPGSAVTAAVEAAGALKPEGPAKVQEEASGEEREIKIDTSLYQAVLSTKGGRFKSFALTGYRSSIEPESPPVEMIQAGDFVLSPAAVEIAAERAQFDDAAVYYEADRPLLDLGPEARGSIVLKGHSRTGAVITKKFDFTGDSYEIGLEVVLNALPWGPRGVSVLWTSALVPHKPEGYRSRGVEGVALQGRTLRREKPQEGGKATLLAGDVRWVGVEDEYFLAAMAPAGEKLGDARFRRLEGEPGGIEAGLSVSTQGERGLGEKFVLYVGPKDVSRLSRVGHGFQRAVDFGWFSTLALGALWLLEKLHSMTGNYGIDIILLTVMIKLAFVPLTHKSTKSMRDMQKLQPQMARLKEKYKEDREGLNREMMALYKRHGVNPLGGCLPMLLQFPVFIALYQVLGHSIQLRHAPFALWIRDLAAHECYLPGQEGQGCNLLSVGGLPVPGLVILMGLSMIAQQWLTPTAPGGDPAQQRMMMILLPVIFTVMFVNFPAGLVLYWLVNNVLTVTQQWITNRYVKA